VLESAQIAAEAQQQLSRPVGISLEHFWCGKFIELVGTRYPLPEPPVSPPFPFHPWKLQNNANSPSRAAKLGQRAH